MTVLATSPTAIRVLDMNIWNALGSFEAALILQQLHYWMEKQSVGVVIEGKKFIYKCDSFLRNQGVFNTARGIERISLSNPIWVE